MQLAGLWKRGWELTDSGMAVAEQTAVDAADDGMNYINKTSCTDVRLSRTHRHNYCIIVIIVVIYFSKHQQL